MLSARKLLGTLQHVASQATHYDEALPCPTFAHTDVSQMAKPALDPLLAISGSAA